MEQQKKQQRNEQTPRVQNQAKDHQDCARKQQKQQIHKGIYIADERKKGQGGFIKCKQLDRKIQLNLRRDDDIILHQTQLEWVKISEFSRKAQRQQRKQQKSKRNNKNKQKCKPKKYQTKKQSKYKPKYQQKKQQAPKIKFKPKEQTQKQQTQKQQTQIVHKKVYKEKIEPIQKSEAKDNLQNQQQKQIEILNKQIQNLNITQKSNKAIQREQQDKYQADQRDDLSSEGMKDDDEVQADQKQTNQQNKKEEDDIVWVGKVVNKNSCVFWDKPFVAIMKFEQIDKRNKNKYKDKNDKLTHVQRILKDYYLDAEPIHLRLPYFQINPSKQAIQIIEAYVQNNLKFQPEDKGGKIRNTILDEMQSIYCLVKYSQIHKKMAYCDLVKIIGKTKTIDGQCNCFLYQHQLNDFQHHEVEQEKQIELNTSPIHKKFDQMVFTIDPPTSTDLDDALSISKNKDGTYEIGIHIADVSSYLQKIDRQQILKRSTSVYLPHQTYHMLPSYLVKICSLNPGVERLAFSIYVKMNKEGKFIGQSRIQKNILTSRFKLSYRQVQDIITKQSNYQSFNKLHPCDERQYENLVEKILDLTEIGMAFRNSRIIFDVFQNRELKYELNEQKWPIAYTIQNRLTSQKIVQEFMIIGNIQAAKKMVQINADNALIIHHPMPSNHAIKSFNDNFEFQGLKLKFQNIRQVQQDLLKVKQMKDVSQQKKSLCYFKARRVQETAGYKLYSQIPQIQKKQKQSPIIHFALGLPYYTHFTSPMRRIGDIIVHQTLTSSLRGDQNPVKIKQEQIAQANWSRTGTKRLKKDLNEIFLCLLIYHQKKKIECDGIVASFGARSVSIFIPMLDMLKEVYWYQLDVKRASRNKQTDKIQVLCYYDKYDAKKDIVWKIQKFQKIRVSIGCTEQPPLRLTLQLDVNISQNKKRLIKTRI